MKYAILADIHGNSWALEAVIAHARQRGAERFINLGDIFYGPLRPGKTYEILQNVDAMTIRGNQDREMIERLAEKGSCSPTMRFALDDLPTQALGWLRSLPAAADFDGAMFLCHGTPENDAAYLLEDISLGYPRVKPDAAIIEQLASIRRPLVLCGHTHIPRAVELSTGVMVLNPGSVGLPAYDDDAPSYHAMETHSPRASYALADESAGGWVLDLVKVPYDHRAAADEANAHGRADWVRWIMTGRAAP